MGHDLSAIADAQHGDTQLEQLRRAEGGVLGVNAARTAGKNDTLVGSQLRDRGPVGLDLAVDPQVPDTAGNELGILPAKVQHDQGAGRLLGGRWHG